MMGAYRIRVTGTVQGVGFRPFVLRLAREAGLTGWVLNAGDGVDIHVEGLESRLDSFGRDLRARAPGAADVATVSIEPVAQAGFDAFTIHESREGARPTTRISPDLATCDDCRAELFDTTDPRFLYPYINCTACGPRYSIIRNLPYDRAATTMAGWPMDAACAAEYHDPASRRFHAQPVACARCGPGYVLEVDGGVVRDDAIPRTAELLRQGVIVAIKGIGGYHLACDARNVAAVMALRERKFRKEKPFALMASDLAAARCLVDLTSDAVALITSTARPIVLAPARITLDGVAPESDELGVMLPYSPLHDLLFRAGAPDPLVMTSANVSNEPIAFDDDDARTRLRGIADAFLVGERPIARRVEDSVARAGPAGMTLLRRSRGYAPGAVAELPSSRPILALGADLKNTVTLVVDGQAFVSQFVGDLEQYDCLVAHRATIDDLLRMYDLDRGDVSVVHDLHPGYHSTQVAQSFGESRRVGVQHHRAHVASVLAERGALHERMIGVAFDGTGYGDDGSIWGGEFFVGSVRDGFQRVAHVREAELVGGDAAARHPVQAAVGFLDQIEGLPDLTAPPFDFPDRYAMARSLLARRVRCVPTSSAGRLFDAAAALAGFTRAVSFEGQAAMWLETLARGSSGADPYPFPFHDGVLDFRPLLAATARDRRAGRAPADIALAFHRGVASGIEDAVTTLCTSNGIGTVALSGGVMQNLLLLEDVTRRLAAAGLTPMVNHAVPPNDGGVSLGQAALAACLER